MGRGILRQKNSLKRQYLSQAKNYIEQLETQNEKLIETLRDPNQLLGQLIMQNEQANQVNSRLSSLVAVFINKSGGSVTVLKEELESFDKSRVAVNWRLPEGVGSTEETKEFIFTYDAIPIDAPLDVKVTGTIPAESDVQENPDGSLDVTIDVDSVSVTQSVS
jgi:hypothetical protein